LRVLRVVREVLRVESERLFRRELPNCIRVGGDERVFKNDY